MKKIIFCLTNDIHFDRRIQRSASALSESYEVEIVARKIFDQGYENKKFNSLRIKCLFNSGFLFYMEFNIRLLLILLFKKSEIIVAVDYDTIFPVRIACKLKRSKFVFDAHEYFEESIEICNRPRIQKFWKWIGKVNVPDADLIYTVSKSIANEYHNLFKKEVSYIRNVPYYQFHDKDDTTTDKKVILYQGVLNKGRKLELLIDASAYLSSEFEIWILGEGDLSLALKDRANNMCSDCKIIFHSWVQPEDLYNYTKKAFLAYNLLDNFSKSYYFSLANKFFDYLQAGVPSLNSAFPEYSQLNEEYECCYIQDIGDSKELADYIKKIVMDHHKYEKLKANSLIAAKSLCWENESQKLKDLYQFL